MVRLSLAMFWLLSIAGAAKADFWVDYLEIRCEPAISTFSVRPVGTENYDGDAPEGFYPIDQESDRYPNCEIEKYDRSYLFEIIRTESHAASECHNCGTPSARFEIRLNGKALAEGLIGRTDMRPIDTIAFNGKELFKCQSLASYSFRAFDDQGQVSLSCSIIEFKEY